MVSEYCQCGAKICNKISRALKRVTLKVNNQTKRPTIYDLAEIADTSATAVSSVLNGTWEKRRISKKLAEKILLVAKEQGYSVNIQASVLRRERSNIIGMIMPKYDNRYFGAIAEQFEILARQNGLFPVITCTQRDPELEIEAARELLAYQVDCLISTGATNPDKISAFCKASGVRTINLDLPGKSAPSIISDNYSGAKELTRHILDLCSRNLGPGQSLHFVGGRASDHNTGQRMKGFVDAHRDIGINVKDDRILACGYAADKACAALENIKGDVPVGLFVNSTITLEGVVRWLGQMEGEAAAKVKYGAFDWDPFAALLPQNVGMVRQDVSTMLDKVFEILKAPTEQNEMSFVPCIVELRN